MADNIHIFCNFNMHMEKLTPKGFWSHHRLSGFCPTCLRTSTLPHTQDLVLSRVINIVDRNVFPPNPGLLHHYFNAFSIATNNLLRPQPRIIKSRAINSRTTQRFLDALPDSLHLSKVCQSTTIV